MTLSGSSKIYKHPKAHTLYISIPARMVQDSQFDFKAGDKVQLKYVFEDTKAPVLVITKLRREGE